MALLPVFTIHTRSVFSACARPVSSWCRPKRIASDIHKFRTVKPHQFAQVRLCAQSISRHMPFSRAVPDSLLDRNQSWSKAFESQQPDIAQALREGQHPKVLWIGCSDSRVPESVVCNARPGELFVLRNVANQFHLHDDSAVSALTFAVQALGVEHIIVVGHTSCGGVVAAVKQVLREQDENYSEMPANTALTRHLSPLTDLSRYLYMKLHERHSMEQQEINDRLVRLVTEASVRKQIQNIVEHPVVQDNWNQKVSPLNGKVNPRVSIHGWIHNLGTSLSLIHI